MNRLVKILLILLIVTSRAFAQNIAISEGEAQRELTRSESREAIEKDLETQATINALEKAFGRLVIQGNSTYIENVSDGKKTETKSVFSSIANTFVKGEPLEILDKKYTDIKHTVKIDGKKVELVDIKCTIKIKARELLEPPIEFKLHTTPCEDDFLRCEASKFKEGDNFYVYFKTPESGFLNVYADQDGTSFKLLPYEGVDATYENGMPVKPNIDYLFFSKRNNVFENVKCTQLKSYLAQGKTFESIRLFVIFSKYPLPQMLTENGAKVVSNEQTYRLPASMKSEDFQRWMQRVKASNAKCNVEIKDITIEK